MEALQHASSVLILDEKGPESYSEEEPIYSVSVHQLGSRQFLAKLTVK